MIHDYAACERELLACHPLVESERAQLIGIEPGTGAPAKQRNLGWRKAKAPLVAFTDDDCRPDTGWLEALLRAAAGGEAILQGATRPDPFEKNLTAAPHYRTLQVDPPNVFAQTCNIAYPRALLQALDGFDEEIPSAAGEDTDLGLRAQALGARQIGVPDALVFHAVEELSFLQAIRATRKWEHLPLFLRKHPGYRRHLLLGLFWRTTHVEYYAAAGGATLARKTPFALLLTLPYLLRAINKRGSARRGRAASLMELPGRIAVDTAEVLTMIRGSIRYRTPML